MKNPFKIENLYKSWYTTVLGFIIILASIVSVFIPDLNVSWTEAGVGIAIGVAFLGVKDPDKSDKVLLSLMLLLALAFLSSCVTYSKCERKYGRKETPIIPVYIQDSVKTQVITLADSAIGTWSLEEVANSDIDQEFKTVSERGKASVTISKTKDNNLKAKANCLPDTVTKWVPYEVLVDVPCPEQTVFTPRPTGLGKLWEDYKSLAAIALPFLVILFWVLK
jgi:hypothetical protein